MCQPFILVLRETHRERLAPSLHMRKTSERLRSSLTPHNHVDVRVEAGLEPRAQ